MTSLHTELCFPSVDHLLAMYFYSDQQLHALLLELLLFLMTSLCWNNIFLLCHLLYMLLHSDQLLLCPELVIYFCFMSSDILISHILFHFSVHVGSLTIFENITISSSYMKPLFGRILFAITIILSTDPCSGIHYNMTILLQSGLYMGHPTWVFFNKII